MILTCSRLNKLIDHYETWVNDTYDLDIHVTFEELYPRMLFFKESGDFFIIARFYDVG